MTVDSRSAFTVQRASAAASLCIALLLEASPALADSFRLPFFSASARERGYELPEPFGAGLLYSDTSQDLQLDQLVLDGNSSAPIDFVDLGKSKLETQAVQLTVDAFLLPFLDVFAFYGPSKSKMKTDFSLPVSAAADYLGLSVCNGSRTPALCGQTFEGSRKIDSNGSRYGFGGALAAGRRPWFGVLGFAYSWISADSIDGEVQAWSLTPRIGRSFALAGGSTLTPYAGGLYLHSKVKINGNIVISAADFPLLGEDRSIPYSADAQNAGDWSTVAGLGWGITPHWQLRGEAVFGNAQQGFNTLLAYRF